MALVLLFLGVFISPTPLLPTPYIAFQVDKPHSHNQDPVGVNGHSPLLWSAEMKTAVMHNFRCVSQVVDCFILNGAIAN